jgi:hypothetical protein
MEYFIDHVGVSFDRLWTDMASWTSLPDETADALVSGVQEEAGDRPPEELARWRDQRLVQLLKVIYGT